MMQIESEGYTMTELQRIRKERGLTQAQLADKAGVSLRMVQYYEQGYKDINTAEARTAVRIADALGVDIHRILEKGEE